MLFLEIKKKNNQKRAGESKQPQRKSERESVSGSVDGSENKWHHTQEFILKDKNNMRNPDQVEHMQGKMVLHHSHFPHVAWEEVHRGGDALISHTRTCKL